MSNHKKTLSKLLPRSIYLDILANKSEPILYEDDEWFVILSNRPTNEGHLLLIPKMQESKFHRLPKAIASKGIDIAQKLSVALEELYNPPQVVLFIKGFTTKNHVHIHVTPAYQSSDMDVDPGRNELSSEEMNALAMKLTNKINEALKP